MVRPIEVSDNLAKTQAAERVNQIMKAAPDMDQRQLAQMLGNKMLQKQQQALPTKKTDEVIIHRDKQNQEKKKKKDKNKKKKTNTHLDLKA